MLRPITIATAFHVAISQLWNQTQFNNEYLMGYLGVTTPAVMPCVFKVFSQSCDKTLYITSHPDIFPGAADSASLGRAAASLAAPGPVTGTWQIVTGEPFLFVKASGPMTCSNGMCNGTITATDLAYAKQAHGIHKVAVTLTYTYLGLPRTWYQLYSFKTP